MSGLGLCRLVLNHSTHVEGLKGALQKLATVSGINTLVPGRLATSRSKHEGFKLHISVATPHGFKLIARRGKTAQEVFVVTDLNREDLDLAIAKSTNR
jgi:hypothetical protein